MFFNACELILLFVAVTHYCSSDTSFIVMCKILSVVVMFLACPCINSTFLSHNSQLPILIFIVFPMNFRYHNLGNFL